MPLKLMYITNNPKIAKIAESSGVDWIFIDLEKIGKKERQGHVDSVKSRHYIHDIPKIKDKLATSELLVRVNPINKNSRAEIEQVINNGADIVMLPYFKTVEEVEVFINIVHGRVQSCLLLETPEAVNAIDDILEINGINFIHIGLNDLHLGYDMHFMFELLADGTVETLCNKIHLKNIPYGFGGIAQIGEGDLPAERIIAEHYRLESSMVILSRSFFNQDLIDDFKKPSKAFELGVKKIRDYERKVLNAPEELFLSNKIKVEEIVEQITTKIKQSRL